MILLQTSAALPAAVEEARAKVLAMMGEFHLTREFTTVGELRTFLEEVSAALAAEGFPDGLTRVILFSDQDRALLEVGHRMVKGGMFHAFKAPRCWLGMAARLSELRAWMDRIEPSFLGDETVRL